MFQCDWSREFFNNFLIFRYNKFIETSIHMQSWSVYLIYLFVIYLSQVFTGDKKKQEYKAWNLYSKNCLWTSVGPDNILPHATYLIYQ